MLCSLVLMSLASGNLSKPESLLMEIDPKRMRATVEKLASFHTRNTVSPGLEEAAEWLAGQYRALPGMQVEVMKYVIPKGRRVPHDQEVVEVIAALPGADDRRVIIGGHMDTINLQADPLTGRAPGANDDGSGCAVTLELARLMSGQAWPHTLVFVAFSGEEQGLYGSKALAKRAKAEGWHIDAVLSNDMVGSSGNKHGQKDEHHVRVFSEEPTKDNPGHNSRELGRFIEWTTRGKVKGFEVKLVFRRDRFGRGGDHTPFVEEGFSAVRFVEVHEEYGRQHTPDDLPEAMDWNYLANVARVNLLTLQTLAQAGTAPTDVLIKRDQSHDTTITWKHEGSRPFVVYWRETTSPAWQGSETVGNVGQATIRGVNKDDHVFAVGTKGGIPVEAK